MLPTAKREPPGTSLWKIAIIDPHLLTRERIAEIVKAHGAEPVWAAGTVREALDLANQLCPDCVIFEFGLPDGSGAQILAALRAVSPLIRGAAVSAHDQQAYRALTYAAGGVGYLTQAVGDDSVAAALKEVLAGRLLWTVREIAMARAWWACYAEPWRRLSPRQRAVAPATSASMRPSESALQIAWRELLASSFCRALQR